jgi:hypothetical protein
MMAKFDIADLEIKLTRGRSAARVTIPGADLRELLEIAERTEDRRIAKLTRVRKASAQDEVKLKGEEFRTLLTLAIKAQQR